MEEIIKEIMERVDKLEKRNTEIYEGLMATTNELCDTTKELERFKVRDEILVENNTLLIHQKAQLEEELDKVLDRINEAIEYINDMTEICDDTYTKNCDGVSRKRLIDILKGEDNNV